MWVVRAGWSLLLVLVSPTSCVVIVAELANQLGEYGRMEAELKELATVLHTQLLVPDSTGSDDSPPAEEPHSASLLHASPHAGLELLVALVDDVYNRRLRRVVCSHLISTGAFALLFRLACCEYAALAWRAAW